MHGRRIGLATVRDGRLLAVIELRMMNRLMNRRMICTLIGERMAIYTSSQMVWTQPATALMAYTGESAWFFLRPAGELAVARCRLTG